MPETLITIHRTAPKRSSAAGMVARLMLAIVGAALMVSSLGLWAFPPSGAEAGMALIRLAMTLFMAAAGLACILCATAGRDKAEEPQAAQGVTMRPHRA
ncbi:hypothetical protein [Cognatishimia sp. F0-27]|uniref:hypothetical protein n=1 Tax=Cognatishimia sp. F0-27 TaxID=2816855 RepID=UPI001D0C1623|nr:hypothetical protein [Cognatishimia sp. F0-27]MCC1494784.1 hypothetical protein [Cognatishimia sp. F0-27]